MDVRSPGLRQAAVGPEGCASEGVAGVACAGVPCGAALHTAPRSGGSGARTPRVLGTSRRWVPEAARMPGPRRLAWSS